MPANMVSVVIGTRGECESLRAAILSVIRTDVSEIIVVSNAAINLGSISSDGRVKLLVAPGAGASEARNLGISQSTGDIIAFTDDDCTVPEDWPLRALEFFRDSKVGVVGGPGVTHPGDGLLSKCSGAALSTRLGTSSSVYRYSAISDHPKMAGERQLSSCNLFVRKRVLEDAGYFHTALYPCEENELIDRIRSAGHIILYVPTCIVFHHRRPLFRPFLEQISNYAKGRAMFSVMSPRRLKPVCLVPSILVLVTLVLPVLLIFSHSFADLIVTVLALYLLITACAAVTSTVRNHLKLRFAPIVFLGIVTMHYCYGFSFLIGLYDAVKPPANLRGREFSRRSLCF